MLVGHFAVALAGKRIEPRLSLGTLTLAAMLPDLLWPIFTMAGIEYTGLKQGAISDGLDAPFSHSLLTVPIWAIVFVTIYFMIYKNRRAAVILFLAIFSHWVLDSISGKNPLAPGTSTYFGLALWRFFVPALIVEGGLWLAALVLYVRATRARNFAGRYIFWLVIVFLTLIWVGNIRSGAPPPSAVAGSLIFFLLCVAWAYWMNSARRSVDLDQPTN
jgi:LexA-binding, inner membrane-associated putative hydrolase